LTDSIFIKHAVVCTFDKNHSETPNIIDDGAVVTSNQQIVSVGKTEDLAKDFRQTDTVIDASGKIVIPGLVSAHTHIAATFLRGLLEDIDNHFYGYALPLEEYLTQDAVFKFSLLGAVEALKYGITCINDIYHYSEATAKAVSQVGLRAVIAHKVFDANLSKIKDGSYERSLESGIKRLRTNEKLVKEWNGGSNQRISCRIGPHAPDTCSPELLRASRESAKRLGVGIHMHLSQSQKEVEYIRRNYNKSSVEYANDLGLLDSDTVAAHAIFASETDLEILKRKDVAIVQCPSIYGKVGVFPKFTRMLNDGIRLGLGTDWLSMDIWDNLRQAIGINRILSSSKSLSATKVLQLATVGSARVLKKDHEIGALFPSMKADIVLLNGKGSHMRPLRNPIQNLVYYANMNDIDTVIVDGQIVVEKGQIKTVNEEDIVADAQASAEQIWPKIPYPSIIK
jgi:5-methylthioadenosine/S-adenosylhomocysteine deaminase